MGRLEAELLGPMVERIFGILSRLKVLPDAPQQIQGHDFTVEYVSPIATAQKQQSANGMMQAMQSVGVFGPEIAAQIASKNLNTDNCSAGHGICSTAILICSRMMKKSRPTRRNSRCSRLYRWVDRPLTWLRKARQRSRISLTPRPAAVSICRASSSICSPTRKRSKAYRD
jgi:hypothetical protein